MSSGSSSPPPPPGLPAWKRAILERKRAKLAAGLEPARGSPVVPEARPGPPPEPEEEEEREAAAAAASAAAGRRRRPPPEPLVVAESLGPLRENPFMRLESERRRRRIQQQQQQQQQQPPWRKGRGPVVGSGRPPESPSSPPPPGLSQLLELYGAMPGIRTIRADNILIIESRGEEADEGANADNAAAFRGPLLRPRAAATPPLPVTEIRAAEVVVYEPRAASTEPPPPQESDAGEDQPGRVSRLLQKFDRQPRSGGLARGRWRAGEAPRLESTGSEATQEDGLPPTTPPESPHLPCCFQPGGPRTFVQKIGSNSFTVNPRGHSVSRLRATHAPLGLSNGPTEPEEARGPWANPVPPPTTPSAPRANMWKPKPEGATEALPLQPPPPPPSNVSLVCSAAVGSPIGATPPFSPSNSFEILPATKPDPGAIPAHDLKAQALASLRLNSPNSFLFVPHRKEEATPAPPEPPEAPLDQPKTPALPKPIETLVPMTYIDEDVVEVDSGLLPPLKALSPRLEGFDVPPEGNLVQEANDSALPAYRPHLVGSAALSQKGTNTFTVVPKRKPPTAGLEVFSRAWLLEEEEEEEEESWAKARTNWVAAHCPKKRYPTVNEIEVIGGYLSLDKSCMSKSGYQRKKMKISFNESSLQTMFEYPSESSLVGEEEEEEEEEEEYATEVDEPATALFIPRPNTTVHSNVTNSGLSSYTPKHSVEFRKWQEEQPKGLPPSPMAFPHDVDLPGPSVMLTPADKNSLSGFSSEPALYF